MKTRFTTLTIALLLALVLLATTAPAETRLAEIENAGEALVFYPVQEAKEFVLSVSGPCGYQYRQATTKGEVVFRLPKDAVEGSYTYSLDATPIIDPKVMKILSAARGEDNNGRVRELCRDGKLPVAMNQTGGFTVLEQKIVFDPTPENKRDKRDREQ
jgi:hypothetical protein